MLKFKYLTSFVAFSAACALLMGGGEMVRAESAQVVCHGDSITFGSNATQGEGTATGTTYPGVLAARLGAEWKVTNIGRPGWTVEGLGNEASANVDSLYNPNLSQNILIIFAGTNNIGIYHQDGAATFTKMEQYCKARKAAHPWKILVVTIPMAAYPKVYPADFDAKAIRYDALIRRNWRRFADGIIDIQADPRLGAPGDEYDRRYFKPNDFTHLTDAGYKIVGEKAARAVVKAVAHP